MLRQRAQQRRPHAAPAGRREDARREETLPREVGTAGDSRTGKLAVQLGEQEEGAGCGGAADLLHASAALVRDDGHPHLPPGLQVGVRLGRADDDHPLFSQTDTCFRLASVNASRFQPAQRSRNVIPARRAMRSSSAGETERKGIERRSHRPSTSVK